MPMRFLQGGWGGKSKLIAGLALIMVTLLGVGISYAVTGTSSSKNSSAGTPQELCYDSEANWLWYEVGTDDALTMNASLLSTMASRQQDAAAYVSRHHYPSTMIDDLDTAATTFVRNYTRLTRTTPKPDPENQHQSLVYRINLYLHSWDPANGLLGNECATHPTALQQQIAAVPSPVKSHSNTVPVFNLPGG